MTKYGLVYELLPLLDDSHEVHWFCPNESPMTKMRAKLKDGRISFYWTNDDTGWLCVKNIKPSDLKEQGHFVEI